MKVFAISDLHMSAVNPKPMNIFGPGWEGYLEKIADDWKKKVNEDDVVCIAGDISWAMKAEDGLADFAFFENLPGSKVFIKGNHDYWWAGITKLRADVPEGCHLIQNDAVRLGNCVFCGSRGWLSPGFPEYGPADEKIYLRECERLKMAYAAAAGLRQEGDSLICLMHYPPFNANHEKNLFTEIIEKNSTKAVIYGHLHGKDVRVDRKYLKNGVRYYLTSCDLVGFSLVEIE